MTEYELTVVRRVIVRAESPAEARAIYEDKGEEAVVRESPAAVVRVDENDVARNAAPEEEDTR